MIDHFRFSTGDWLYGLLQGVELDGVSSIAWTAVVATSAVERPFLHAGSSVFASPSRQNKTVKMTLVAFSLSALYQNADRTWVFRMRL